MKIGQKSINNLKYIFQPFFNKLEGTNYVISTDVKTFYYHEKVEFFNMENLKTLFPVKDDNTVQGTITPTTPIQSKEYIESCLSYCCNGKGGIEKTKNTLLIKKRISTFWNLVQKHFDLPPEKVYIHNPEIGSYFDYGFMWHFCYIFLKDGKGIVLDAGAFD